MPLEHKGEKFQETPLAVGNSLPSDSIKLTGDYMHHIKGLYGIVSKAFL